MFKPASLEQGNTGEYIRLIDSQENRNHGYFKWSGNEYWEFIQNFEKSGETKQKKKNFTLRLGNSYQPWAGVQKGRRMLNIDQEMTIFLDWICKMGR